MRNGLPALFTPRCFRGISGPGKREFHPLSRKMVLGYTFPMKFFAFSHLACLPGWNKSWEMAFWYLISVVRQLILVASLPSGIFSMYDLNYVHFFFLYYFITFLFVLKNKHYRFYCKYYKHDFDLIIVHFQSYIL